MKSELSTRGMHRSDGTNFLAWKFQMNALFMASGIKDVVDGSRPLPENHTSPEYSKWIKDDATANYLYAKAMQTEQLASIFICETSKQMWEMLLSIHEQKSATRKLLLTQQFHAYRINPTDTVLQHTSKVQNMARNLIGVGKNSRKPVHEIFKFSNLVGQCRS